MDQELDCNLGNSSSLLPKSDNWQRSPFAIPQSISGIAGTVKDVEKLSSGQILVKCSKEIQAENLLRANVLAGVAMKTIHHPSLNHSKGLIRTRALEDMEEIDITAELMAQDVVNVKRITNKKEVHRIKTGAYIVTFSRLSPQEKIRVKCHC